MSFAQSLTTHFPNALSADLFVRRSYEALWRLGFVKANTFVGIGLCRDELTRPLAEEIEKTWGQAFNFSGLAGMLYLGKAGFTASLHHAAPDEEGSTRHVYFALPHIGIMPDGQIGLCNRPGQLKPSPACGALVAFQNELTTGSIRVNLDMDDIELSLLKQRLIPKLQYGQVPELVALTKIAQTAIREDLERLILLTLGPSHNHYAVLSGIQIHGPQQQTFVWPCETYAVVDGVHHPITLPSPSPAGLGID